MSVFYDEVSRNEYGKCSDVLLSGLHCYSHV
jgi:hypothetical protein